MDVLRDSRQLINKPSMLRRRLAEDGYLYLPSLLPGFAVSRVTALLQAALWGTGVTKARNSLAPRQSTHRFTSESFATTYPSVQRIERMHELARAPELQQLMMELFETPVFCHPAVVLRISSPGSAKRLFTRAHQDFVVLHVCTDVLTAWIALTECHENRQGLRLIPGSHHGGYQVPDPAAGGARPLYLANTHDDPSWATANYSPGDVVIFHSLTVHGGGPNVSDQLRLSIDARYQRTSDPMRSDFAHPHGWPATPDWPSLCEGWSNPSLVSTPAEVQLVPMPDNISYCDFVASLTAPPSSLIQKGRIP